LKRIGLLKGAYNIRERIEYWSKRFVSILHAKIWPTLFAKNDPGFIFLLLSIVILVYGSIPMIIYQQQRVAEPLNILAFYLLVIGVALRLLRFSLPANVNLTSLVLDRLWIFSLFGFFSVLVTALTIMIIYQQQRVAEPLNILAFYLLVIGVALRLLRFLRKQV
jgi:hypothetical protein